MATRDELIEAGVQAVADTGEVWEGDFYGVRDLVGVVLDALRAALRAKVEALRYTESGGYGNAINDVLAVIDGSSDATTD